jgi:DNA-binding response OmpR family regulator
VLRRGPITEPDAANRRHEVRFEGWTVNLSRRELRSPTGAIVDLTGAEFDLLGTFIDQPQRVIGRERLIELSRTRVGDSSDRSIDVLVSRLRRKITAAGGRPPIVTVRGVGYMFNTAVSRA